LKKAIEYYGDANQLNMIKEELAELIVAISHYERGRIGADEVLEEVADNGIVINQLLLMLENESLDSCKIDDILYRNINKKMKRLEKRILTKE